jgi:hypothetical protein
MIDLIEILKDPLAFLHFCYLSVKLRICSTLWSQCHYCQRDAADWSTRRPLCAWHFDEVMSWRQ